MPRLSSARTKVCCSVHSVFLVCSSNSFSLLSQQTVIAQMRACLLQLVHSVGEQTCRYFHSTLISPPNYSLSFRSFIAFISSVHSRTHSFHPPRTAITVSKSCPVCRRQQFVSDVCTLFFVKPEDPLKGEGNDEDAAKMDSKNRTVGSDCSRQSGESQMRESKNNKHK